MAEPKRYQSHRGRDSRAQGAQHNELDDIFAALEAARDTYMTSDQGPPDECLKSVTGGNERCHNEGTFDREVDQRGTDPNSRPDAAT
jgi:hypothetical protein